MSRMTFILALIIGFSVNTYAFDSGTDCNTPQEIVNDKDSKFVAHQFPTWDQISDARKRILTTFFSGADLSAAYAGWVASKNEQAASFFSITHALSLIKVNIKGASFEPALVMVKDLVKAKGDRIIVTMDPVLFVAWKNNGGQYKVGNESGKVGFSNGGTMGGSLHCGYETQGYTDRKYEPSLQWNFNSKNAQADIDMDGHKPTWGGIFPNPKHLTYRNSDVRFWFDKYTKKYGNPGFGVKQRNP